MAAGLVDNPAERRRDRVEGIPIGFDAGIKVFPLGERTVGGIALRPFAGFNYGLVSAGYNVSVQGGPNPLHKDYAFSYTVGLRRTFESGLKGSVYAGITSKADHNRVYLSLIHI